MAMTNTNINVLAAELLEKGTLTDELLELFREIDVMNSVGMMSWLTSTCKDGLKRIEKGDKVTYNGKELDKEGFLGVLNDNISDLLMQRILGVI